MVVVIVQHCKNLQNLHLRKGRFAMLRPQQIPDTNTGVIMNVTNTTTRSEAEASEDLHLDDVGRSEGRSEGCAQWRLARSSFSKRSCSSFWAEGDGAGSRPVLAFGPLARKSSRIR